MTIFFYLGCNRKWDTGQFVSKDLSGLMTFQIISRVQAFCAGDWKFDSQSSEANDLQNLYSSPLSFVLGINRIGHELVSSVSG